MSTTEDTSTIDEKKAEESGTSTSNPDFNKFMKNYLYIIIGPILFSIVFIGGLGLYTTKVSEANILPDNIDFFPYTNIAPVIQQIPVNINIMKPSLFPKEEEILSQKAIFNSKEYLDTFNNSLLHFLQKSSEDPSISLANIPLYLSYVYNNTTCRGFQTLNMIFSKLGYLPEWVVMILYGFLGILLWIAVFFINCFWSWVYHLIYIPQLFRDSYIDKETKKDTWESSQNISFFKNWTRLILLCFFWWLMVILIVLSAVLSPIIITISNLISPFFATYKIKDQDKFINHANGQPINFNILKFLIQTLSYKTFFILIMSTIALVTNGLTYLGTSSLIGILIAIGFAYFMGLYNNPMPEPGVDGFTLGLTDLGLTETNYQSPEIEPTEIQPQSGGKKHKHKLTKHTKKYNIRLV